MFNKVYLGTTPISKIYLGDTPIRYKNIIAIYTVSSDETRFFPLESDIEGKAPDWKEELRDNGDGTYTATITGSYAPTKMKFSYIDILSVQYIDISNMTSMEKMFYNCSTLTSIEGIADWDVSNITNMTSMFEWCSSIATLDLSNWDVSNVIDMSYMFSRCINLISLGNITNWNTKSLAVTWNMFDNCCNLESLDLSGWYTRRITKISSMFSNSSIATLDLSNWELVLAEGDYSNRNVSCDDMFYNCSKLENIILDNCNYSTINKIVTSPNMITSDSVLFDSNKEHNIHIPKGTQDRVTEAPAGWSYVYID